MDTPRCYVIDKRYCYTPEILELEERIKGIVREVLWENRGMEEGEDPIDANARRTHEVTMGVMECIREELTGAPR